MRACGAILLVLPCVGSIACERESSEIQPHEAVVSPSTTVVALGELVTIQAYVKSTATDADLEHGCGTAPVLPTLSVTRATCEPGCNATVDSTRVRVSATSPGTKLVRLELSKSTGAQESRTVTLDFRVPTRIGVTRDVSTSPSGSRYAMVTGDEQLWTVGMRDDAGAITVDPCKIQVLAEGAVDAMYPCEGPSFDGVFATARVRIAARSEGEGAITVRYGALERRDRVRIAAPRAVRSVALHAALPTAAVAIDAGDDDVTEGPHPGSFRFRCTSGTQNAVVPWLELDDGTVALGGARLLRVAPEGIATSFVVEQTATIDITMPVDGRLVAAFGPVSLDVPYEVRSGCPSVDELDGGTIDAGDAGSDATTTPVVDGGDAG